MLPSATNNALRLDWFYGQVQGKGPWDYKQQGASIRRQETSTMVLRVRRLVSQTRPYCAVRDGRSNVRERPIRRLAIRTAGRLTVTIHQTNPIFEPAFNTSSRALSTDQ